MRILDPSLDSVLTNLGATPEDKQLLITFVLDRLTITRNRISEMYANAQQTFNAAQALEPNIQSLEALIEKITNEVPDEPVI